MVFSSCGGILEVRRGSQPSPCVGPGKPNLPLGLRGKAGVALESLHNDNLNVPIEDAEITIIGQNGYKTELAEYDRIFNHYIINTDNLPQNTQYAVKVIWKGETYQSEFQELQSSPEIDEITYKENVDGISIHVSTHDSEDGRRAYMWSYSEDWEFHSDINMFSMAPILNILMSE